MRRFASSPPLVVRTPSGDSLALYVATGFARRLLGLAGLRELGRSRGLLIRRCRSVHTFAMRFPIDVVFFESEAGTGDARVVDVHESVPPMRFARVRAPEARGVSVIELRAGESRRRGIDPGTKLRLPR